MNIHPKIAGFVFIVVYCLICGTIQVFFKINIIDSISFIVVGIILACFIYKFFLDRYDGEE